MLRQPQEQGWKLQAATLEEGLEGRAGPHLLILTNPGNPSGCAYTRAELEALVAVFRRRSVVVLSDEIYARLEYSGDHVCLAELYPEVWSPHPPRSPGHHPHLRLLQVEQRGRVAPRLRALPPRPAPPPAGGAGRGQPHLQLRPGAPAARRGARPRQVAAARHLPRDGAELRRYILAARRVLDAVAGFCQVAAAGHPQERLAEVGVTGRRGRAGYYFMPDFEVVRAGLAARCPAAS